jgi:methionyl aminopeptidase
LFADVKAEVILTLSGRHFQIINSEVKTSMAPEYITLLSRQELEKMRQSGRMAVDLLSYLEPMVKSGVSTLEIDDAAEIWIQSKGIKSAMLGYNGYPKSICTSVNEAVCNAVPVSTQILSDGDIINITVALLVDSYHGKTSRTFFVGEVSPTARRLVEVTEECLRRGIAEVGPGARIGDIGAAIQEYAESQGFSVVRDFVGHGTGRIFHAAPRIPHYGIRGEGPKLRSGMVFTIQPMINQGTWEVEILADRWTAVTKDRQLSAQFEHVVAVTDSGVEILTPFTKDKQ